MELVSADEFVRRTERLSRSFMEEAALPFVGLPYGCACGRMHAFRPIEAEHMPRTPVLRASSDLC